MEHRYPAQPSPVQTSVLIEETEKFPRVQPEPPSLVSDETGLPSLVMSQVRVNTTICYSLIQPCNPLNSHDTTQLELQHTTYTSTVEASLVFVTMSE